jgi:hypothetical protein
VSGGALSSVATYAALADSQLKERATNGIGKPPCLEKYNDSDWFAPHVRAAIAATPSDSRDPAAGVWRPHERWKGCLQLVLAGDFLSPVFVSLVSDDLLQLGFRGDRATTLEQAWEMRYAQMTGQNKIAPRIPSLERSTLGQPMGVVRRIVHDADPMNWMPVLLLNGTSVTTGRRIVTSDVKLHAGHALRGEKGRAVTAVREKTARPFRDIYDIEDMLESGADIRLSTGATMSARFPIISPHGNLRSTDGKLSDRVVDGGYYENFGALTALEMVQILRSHNLKPFVIVVNNDPHLTSMDCVTADSELPRPKPPAIATFSTLLSPLNALLATGGGRATLAAVQLCSEVGQDNFAFITVDRDRYNANKALSMSWWLSMHVQKYLDDQLDHLGINKEAFAKVRGVR